MNKKTKNVLLGIALLLVLVLSWVAYWFYEQRSKVLSDDPTVWEEAIRVFETQQEKSPEAKDAVVFVGSSSIRLWSTLKQDMAPIPVIQRGFGGAKLLDVVHYAERLVNVHAPIAVVVFAGTNDIFPGTKKTPELLLRTYQDFVKKVRKDLPLVPIYYIGITPSLLRWEVWNLARQTNQLIRDVVKNDDQLYFIDTTAGLLGEDGTPDAANYRFDGLHLNTRGYGIWSRIIKSELTKLPTLSSYRLAPDSRPVSSPLSTVQ